MKVIGIRSDEIYKKMISSKIDQRDDINRYELMKPFEFKWSCIGIPIKADKLGGYDVVMASSMGGGIPGYIIGAIIPNEQSLKMQPVALAPTVDILKETEDFWN